MMNNYEISLLQAKARANEYENQMLNRLLDRMVKVKKAKDEVGQVEQADGVRWGQQQQQQPKKIQGMENKRKRNRNRNRLERQFDNNREECSVMDNGDDDGENDDGGVFKGEEEEEEEDESQQLSDDYVMNSFLLAINTQCQDDEISKGQSIAMFGTRTEEIESEEIKMQERFDRFTDEKTPTTWPCIPLNV